MMSVITGAFAMVMTVVYLGYYAVMLDKLPLWIIIVATMIAPLVDYFQEAKQEMTRRTNGPGRPGEDGGAPGEAPPGVGTGRVS